MVKRKRGEEEEVVEDDDDLHMLRVVDLKDRLKELGLSTTGLKDELLERLKAALNAKPTDLQAEQYTPPEVKEDVEVPEEMHSRSASPKKNFPQDISKGETTNMGSSPSRSPTRKIKLMADPAPSEGSFVASTPPSPSRLSRKQQFEVDKLNLPDSSNQKACTVKREPSPSPPPVRSPSPVKTRTSSPAKQPLEELTSPVSPNRQSSPVKPSANEEPPAARADEEPPAVMADEEPPAAMADEETSRISESQDKKPSPSPKPNVQLPSDVSPTPFLRIDNFTRPLCVPDLKILIETFGEVSDFWMDKKRSTAQITVCHLSCL